MFQSEQTAAGGNRIWSRGGLFSRRISAGVEAKGLWIGTRGGRCTGGINVSFTFERSASGLPRKRTASIRSGPEGTLTFLGKSESKIPCCWRPTKVLYPLVIIHTFGTTGAPLPGFEKPRYATFGLDSYHFYSIPQYTTRQSISTA